MIDQSHLGVWSNIETTSCQEGDGWAEVISGLMLQDFVA